MKSQEARKKTASHSFDVFLSYSRKDKEFAIRLEEALESYRMPKSLKNLAPQLNVFRDEADITAADDYYRAIDQHISDSSKLVVICSPDSRKSKYVGDEIKRFIQSRGAQDIIPVLARGKPNNEAANEDEMAFPEPLCENRMPLAANFVGQETYSGSLHEGPYRNAFFSVLAAINNIDRRTLEQIDEKNRARRRAMILSLAGAIILTLSIALVFAISSRREAVRQREEAVRQKLNAEEQTRIATLAKDEAEAARRRLQQQYLEAIGEMSVFEVLDDQALPGEIKTNDPAAWIPLMRQGPLTFAMGRSHGAGRVLAVAHDGVLVGKSERLLNHAFEWLRGPRGIKKILVSSGHCEWVTMRNLKIPSRLKEEEYTVTALPGVIEEGALKNAGVLVIGNAWGNLTANEIAAVEKFVSNGGGLFIAGLGWSWKQDSPRIVCEGKSAGQNINDFSTYPMNRLAAPYNAQWTERFN
ncbi:MAG: TIR domain-containing protein [Blastocatellia bacterium]|nr:TIR domain-containing protein [Blastocatellia bacterium]